MKTLASNIAAHLTKPLTTLVTCWKITRQDGTILRFVAHDLNVTISGDGTYTAAGGISPSDISNSGSMNVDELEVQGVLASSSLEEDDLTAGLYDNAQVEIFLVNYKDPDGGTIVLRKGWIGEVRLISEGMFFAEVRGMMQRLQSVFGEVLTPTCRADLGDARCQVNLTSFTVNGTVASVTSSRFSFTNTATDGQAGNWWAYGKLTWTSGNNNGFVHDIKSSSGNSITLFNPTAYDIEVGDGFTAIAGCNKLIATCRDKFNNVVNFRGEPHLPGIDAAIEYVRNK